MMPKARILLIAFAALFSGAAHAAGDLVGSWETDCIARDQAVRNHLELRDDRTYTLEYRRGLDETCSDVLIVLTGTYTLGAETAAGSGEFPITFVVHTADLTPRTAAGAWGANFLQACTRTDWHVGVTQSILGLDCGSDGIVPVADGNSYDILSVHDGQLMLGLGTSTENRLTPQARPTAFDVELPYRRL